MRKPLIVCTILAIVLRATRLDFNSPDCNKYLGKFGAANNADGQGTSKVAFSGDSSGASKIAFSGDAFIETTQGVTVNLRYSDVEYFNDPTFFGLVQEDGKTPETTCLDMKLYKFPASDYSNGVQVTDLTITPSNNYQKQRYYSFTIKGADLAARLSQTSNSNLYIYKGYYGIAFYAAGTDQLKYTFYFYFTVTVSKATGNSVDTSFKPLSLTASANCTPGGACQITQQTKLNWCSDFTCTKIVNAPDLHLNDQFVLQQVITTSGMTGFYLTGTEVWYTGDGLNKKATIIKSDNATKGQVKVLLNAEIAWRAVTIQVNSVLSNIVSIRQQSTQTTFDTVTGQTSEITCIKAENLDSCATCQQECDANGFSSDDCDACYGQSFSQIIAFEFITLLLVFIF